MPTELRAWTEEELVCALLRHEAPAWREFHARYDRLIFSRIRDVLRRFGRHLDSDAVREVHATLLLSLHENGMHKLRVFDPKRGRNLSSWIGRLATNCAIDYGRKQRRRRQLFPASVFATPHGAPHTSSLDLPSSSADPHRALVGHRQLALVQEAIAGLSARDRQMLTLDLEEGLAAEQIAARMGIAVKTVYTKTHKIRAKLRSALEAA
jgi:RNA polymerase sigma-70 factor (ECF subfamily)